ncbi:MAG: PH domain-containing protein [Phycisphaerales bacterium]
MNPSPTDTKPPPPGFQTGIEIRPLPALWTYYIVMSLLTGPGFPIVLIAMYFRYSTLRYRFDADENGGVWMAHGILMKKEVNLAYRRIQDIHVSRNIIQRWFGLANVSVQTASGSSTPEVVIEGLADPDFVRDFLYRHMRGAKGTAEESPPGLPRGGSEPHAAETEAITMLREIRDSLQVIRARLGDAPAPRELAPGGGGGGGGGGDGGNGGGVA